jgi:site-specific DNA-cytosine methylase
VALDDVVRLGQVVVLVHRRRRIGRGGPRYDILFRMLQPHELALAMSFPAGYQFTGNRAEQVKQIGNAVPVGLARAICFAMLSA